MALSDVKERAISAWGRIVVDGNNVGEVGRGLAVLMNTDNCDDDIIESSLPSTSSLPPAPARPFATARKTAVRKTVIEQQLDVMSSGDDKIANAINNLAEKVGDLAANTAANTALMSDLFGRMLQNQERVINVLMDKLL